MAATTNNKQMQNK